MVAVTSSKEKEKSSAQKEKESNTGGFDCGLNLRGIWGSFRLWWIKIPRWGEPSYFGGLNANLQGGQVEYTCRKND